MSVLCVVTDGGYSCTRKFEKPKAKSSRMIENKLWNPKHIALELWWGKSVSKKKRKSTKLWWDTCNVPTHKTHAVCSPKYVFRTIWHKHMLLGIPTKPIFVNKHMESVDYVFMFAASSFRLPFWPLGHMIHQCLLESVRGQRGCTATASLQLRKISTKRSTAERK